MLVDLHVHTKKCKSGDDKTREVTVQLFSSKIRLAGIKVLAITNHNCFDIEQYNKLKASVADVCDVWPGIEFDVKQLSSKAGHVIVIVNPEKVEDFNALIKSTIGDSTPDSFVINIDNLCSKFNKLDPIFIAHYLKPKSLGEDDLDLLNSKIYNKNRFLKEPSNIVSIGVLNAYDQKCVLGSDVKDWNFYEKGTFSEFKYDFKDYKNFLKLLDKDSAYINDLINQEQKEIIEVYGDNKTKQHPFRIPVYNDVNIIFGDKGSGKSEILASLNDYYISKGIPVSYLVSRANESWFSTLLLPTPNLYFSSTLGCDSNLVENFIAIANYVDPQIVEIESYKKYFKTINKNKNSALIKLNKISKINSNNDVFIRKLGSEYETFKSFLSSFTSSEMYKHFVTDDDFINLKNDLSNVLNKSAEHYKDQWIKNKANSLSDFSIDSINTAVSECTGTPTLPTETGFFKFADERIKLMNNANAIFNNLNKESVVVESTYLGKLGNKGSGSITSECGFANPSNIEKIDSKWLKQNKTDCKDILKKLKSVQNEAFTKNLFDKVSKFKTAYNDGVIKSLNDLIFNKKSFILGSKPYKPSAGEIAILSIEYEILKNKTNKSIFLFDEPELSLGNEYIETNIVPLIKDLAKSGKTVVIATHNANIAVRTGAINSILKTANNSEYNTYIGSMYTNELKSVIDNEIVKWDAESERTLEGGEKAFKERGYYYGEDN
ncbi:MAG: hypothetical protein MJ225_03130 [Bacilli bacterium]|nr:hypothetical protein [Bacilli bacterium]